MCHPSIATEAVSAFSPANNPGRSDEKKTTTGGGDMEVHKTMLIYYVVTENHANLLCRDV